MMNVSELEKEKEKSYDLEIEGNIQCTCIRFMLVQWKFSPFPKSAMEGWEKPQNRFSGSTGYREEKGEVPLHTYKSLH